MKKRIAAWIVLGLITLGSGFLLSMTNEVTKGTIQTQEAEAKIIARQNVLSSAERFEVIDGLDIAPLTELYVGKAGDEVVGYVGIASSKGYAGKVQVITGIDTEGKVSGISVGSSDFNETAGLGAKAKDSSFQEQFVGINTPVRAVKAAKDRAENTVDAITAATITTNAVTSAVNQVANKVDAYLNPDEGAIAEGTTYTASAQGFAGPVAVFVTVKDDGTISAISIGDEKFAETEGYGANAKEPNFTKQFIGKSVPMTIESIDAISGATITSKAVIEAVNKAFEDKIVVKPALPAGIRYTASEKGFVGPVAVFVTVDEKSMVTALSVGDESFAETEGYGAGAKDPAFTKQFVGMKLPISIEKIDTVSGATITTTAVVNATNRAYNEKLVDETSNDTVVDSAITELPSATDVPGTIDTAVSANSSSKGYGGPVAVTITLNEDNTIASLLVGNEDFAETTGFGSRAKDEEFTSQFIGRRVPLEVGDIDVIAGATITSEAVIKAVNKAAEKLVPELSDEAAESQVEQIGTALREATSSSKGYAGPVAVTITLNEDDTIASLHVGDKDFAETAGFGSRAKDEEFTSQFIGKKIPLEAGDIDVIAGATITSEAVIKAVNKAAEKLIPELTDEAAESQVDQIGTALREATSSSKGYAGPVAITIALNEDDTIASLLVGDADFAETAGFGSRAKDEEFTSQFIGKKIPLEAGDIDVIAGATITSEAVIKAVNKAAEKLMPELSDEAAESQVEQIGTALREATSSSKGYAGPVAVTITLNEDDTIASLHVGDKDFAETAGFGSRAKDEEFTSQFIGKKIPLEAGDIDVIAGATITSEAVIKAVNKAAEKLMPELTYEAAESQVEQIGTALRGATSSSKGYAGPVAVTITLNEDDTIASLHVGDEDFAETAGFGSRAKDEEFTSQFIGKKAPLKTDDIDVIAGATITSEAVIKAVNKAVEKLLPILLREATSSSKGYVGPVAVTIILNEDDAIASLLVGDEDFAETTGFGSKAKDDEFTSQFIGKKVPLNAGDIDAIAGATITSEAVIKAVNKAAEKLMPSVVLREATSSSKGYAGPVAVTITLNEDDTIASLIVGDEDSAETNGFGSKAKDEEFTSQFIGKKVPLEAGDIDVISGATITSEAVIKAVNKAAEKLLQK